MKMLKEDDSEMENYLISENLEVTEENEIDRPLTEEDVIQVRYQNDREYLGIPSWNLDGSREDTRRY
jgi:hypothetical protein